MKYSCSIPNQGSSNSQSIKILAQRVLKFPRAGVFLSPYMFSQMQRYPFGFLKGSLKRAHGLSQTSESEVGAYPVEEPS